MVPGWLHAMLDPKREIDESERDRCRDLRLFPCSHHLREHSRGGVRGLANPDKTNCHKSIGSGYIWTVDTHETETDLVEQVQAGDLEAFEELLDLHSIHLRAFVAMKLPISHLVDEIAHETFVFAHRHINDFKAGTDFGKWLRAIAYNLIRKETLRHQRLSKNNEKYLDHLLIRQGGRGEFSPESPVIVYLDECLRTLPEQQRALLDHKYKLAQSSREMSAAFNQSESWVRTTLCRIRTALKQCIETKMIAATR